MFRLHTTSFVPMSKILYVLDENNINSCNDIYDGEINDFHQPHGNGTMNYSDIFDNIINYFRLAVAKYTSRFLLDNYSLSMFVY